MKLTPISIKSLTVSAIAASTLVGMGLASAPAQAGVFSVTGSNTENQCDALHPNSPFWQGSFSSCDGFNNGLVSFTGGKVLVEYYGKGVDNPAQFTNGFQLDSINWQSPPLPANLGATPASFNDPSITGTGFTAAPTMLTLTAGNIPFQFLNNIVGGVAANTIKNGDPFTQGGPAHYFAYQQGNSVYLGLDDSGSSANTSDAEDFLVKITAVPESSNVLGLLVIGGLGLATVAKGKKQK